MPQPWECESSAMSWRRFPPVGLALLLPACAPAFAQTDLAPGRTVWAAFEDQGEHRSFSVHLPPGDGNALPLVVVLHGGGSSGARMEDVTGWSALADREGFAVVYPDGLGGVLGLGRAWSYDGCCGYGALLGVDDIAMVEALLSTLEARVDVDPHRRYVVGYSNGGTLAHGLASRSSDLFAAMGIYAGPVAARGSLEAPIMPAAAPEPALSVMLVMSEQDPRVPFYGSEGRTVTPSQPQLAQFYAGAAGCARHPDVTRTFDGAVDVHRFLGCRPGLAVEQLTLWGWNHEWPGHETIRGCRAPGEQLYEFDAATQMWAFFRDKRR